MIRNLSARVDVIDSWSTYDGTRGLSINGLVKSLLGKRTFSASWKEDIDGTVNVYYIITIVRQESVPETLDAIPVMFSVDGPFSFLPQAAGCRNYSDAIADIEKKYNAADELYKFWLHGCSQSLQKKL